MAISVTAPLLREHAEIRERLGELKSNLDQFTLAGLRQVVSELKELITPHALKEEAGLYLLGMKFLQEDNDKLPSLFMEHHKTSDHIAEMIRLLYGPRLVSDGDYIRQLGQVLIEEITDHLDDEEQVVWPALERLIPEQTKLVILERYRKVKNSDLEFDRSPLLSLPDQPQMPIPAPAPPTLGSMNAGGGK